MRRLPCAVTACVKTRPAGKQCTGAVRKFLTVAWQQTVAAGPTQTAAPMDAV